MSIVNSVRMRHLCEGPSTRKPNDDQKYEVDCEPANNGVHGIS